MSRVIKFRAWFIDGEHKIMDGQVMSYPKERGLAEFLNDVEDAKLDHGYNVILQQFTGLQDSKGVDVYGDDLLDDKWRAQVYWKNGSWWVHLHVGDNADKLLYDYLKSREQAKCPVEVIGNIHENGDLLND